MRLLTRPNILGLFLVTRLGSANTPALVEPGSRDNSDRCECYLLSGSDAGYFQHHRFYDFRNTPSDVGNDYTIAPPLITDAQKAGGQEITSAYLSSTDFQRDWTILNAVQDAHSSVPSVNSAANVYISRNTSVEARNSTYLTLRATRLVDFVSIAELDNNQKNMFHSSIRARMRVIPNGLPETLAPIANTSAVDNATAGSNSTHPVDPGAVLGLFTYQSDVQESDIEILTLDPITHVRSSNQPDFNVKTGPVDGASTDMTLPDGNIWTEWLDYRLDWFPQISRWYVNGQLQLEKSLNVPKKPSGLILNLWGDGGQWSGNMTVGGQVVAGIEWIEMVFNVSGSLKGSKQKDHTVCLVGCTVDGVKNIGFPELAYNATGSDAARVSQSCSLVSVVCVSIAILVTVGSI